MRAPVPARQFSRSEWLRFARGTTAEDSRTPRDPVGGALGSPAILLRSKVPNDQIGRGAVLHASMPVLGKFDHTVDALVGTQASVFVDDFLISRGYALESMSAEPLYAGIMAMGPAKYSLDMIMSYRNLGGFGLMLIDTPSPNNRVRLNADGEPEVEYTLSDADKARFRQGVAEAVRIMFRAGAKQVFLPTNEDILGENSSGRLQPLALTDIRQADAVEKNLEFIPNRSIVTSAHLQATNKTGRERPGQRGFEGVQGLGNRRALRSRRQRVPDLDRSQSNAKHLYVRQDFRR